GATLETAGFEVRVPALSRRKPSPTLRLFTEPTGDTVVGAHQLSNVRWSALFDDVELTAAEVLRLAAEARPLVRSRGKWVELGGCLALDMGLGKTPTVLAHLARTAGNGPALVIAPPAVVGNWASEAARFSPKLRVVIHHGASRASAAQLAKEVERADVLITTYGTAVRDIDALAEQPWDRVILDEAQAIKNPANETAQQLRRLPARVRLALTGTPIENGLGDLWAILDVTNPGLVGTRATFVSQLSGEGEV